MTEAARHAQATALFSDALALPTDEREAWLTETCGDTGLREQVAGMLRQHTAGGGLLDVPLVDLGDAPDPLLGQTVGPWRVVGLLGRGGMGSVYRAERAGADAPGGFRQSAALKMVRLGSGADFRARFLRERALLAGLEHPGIARLLDGGLAPDGTPYLAMELVDGEPITRHAEAVGLGVSARLGLFLEACEAVAYAHRNLVVHLDLKPEHVVVGQGSEPASPAPRSSSPSVKLLDFGVAKLLGAEDEILTQAGGGPLTPAYAAPEQLLGHPVTTATDVYALGVILYELLAGQRPYGLAGLTAAQMEAVVTEAVPPRPSTMAPTDRRRVLRGDLDAIVMRALAKEPERRYASAEALAQDLLRHLSGVPVEARPPTAAYRARRFVRRHRVGVLAAVLVAGAVLGGAGLALASAQEARRAQAEAETQAARAESQAERAEAVAGFLEQILRAPNARWYVDAEAKGPDTPIRAVLAEAARRVDADFADQPDLRADLHHVLGDTYVGLGMSEEAGRHHRETLAIRESLYTPPHPALAEALYYAAAYIDPDDVLTELDALQRAAAMLRQRPEGNNFPFIQQEVADFSRVLGLPEAAREAAREGLAFVDTVFVPGHGGHRYRTSVSFALTLELALASLDAGETVQAARWLVSADSLAVRLPASTRDLLVGPRGLILAAAGRYAEAEPLLLASRGPRPHLRPGARAVLEDYAEARARETLAMIYGLTARADLARAERESIAAHLASRDSLRAVSAASE